MHEMALAQSVVQIIEDAAVREAFRRVRTVWLEVGRLSCVEPEAMRSAFEVASRSTPAAGAALEIVEVAGRARCPACGASVALVAREDACSECGSYGLAVVAGTELRVKELEVESWDREEEPCA